MADIQNDEAIVALRLTNAQLDEAIHDRELLARLDTAPIDFVTVGLERFAPGETDQDAAPHHAHESLDSSVLATALQSRTSHLGVVAAASAHGDHPYNIARRIESLDLLSGGRTGVILTERDLSLAGDIAWKGISSQADILLSEHSFADSALLLQKLWQSWPAESLVADHDSGIYTQAQRIRHADHCGVFQSAGPLNVTTTPQGTPVLLGFTTDLTASFIGAGDFELLVLDSAAEVSADTDTVQVPWIREIELNGDHASTTARARTELTVGAHGVLLTAGAHGDGLTKVLDEVAAVGVGLRGSYGNRASARTLRARLGLQFQRDRLTGARAAFQVPQPLPAQ